MNSALRVPVLMYHRVGQPDHAHDVYCISPERFAAHMHALAGAGHRAVPIEAFHAWRNGAQALPDGAFVLTFDDGFTGVYEFSAPVLAELGWSATVFLVAGKLGGRSDWRVTVDEPMQAHPLMDGAQLRSLAERGHSLHSHSFLHRDLTTLDEAVLLEDLRNSRESIAELVGKPPMHLAYPYGRHNEQVRFAAQEAGFVSAFSVEPGFNRSGGDDFRIRRLDVFGTDSPAMLLRKIKLGSNDGSLTALLTYYTHRLLRMS